MASNVKILVVDDNPMVLGMLQQALAPLGEVSAASDSADALLKAVEEIPDLLISDYRMPGMDGRQLLEKLKGRPATSGIAVILMASKADISERLSLQDPIEDHLEKPFFLKDAVRKIKRVVDRIALEKLAKAALDRRHVPRQPGADERDRPRPVVGDGTQELPAHDDQRRRQVRDLFRSGAGQTRRLWPDYRRRSGFQSAALDGRKFPDRF